MTSKKTMPWLILLGAVIFYLLAFILLIAILRSATTILSVVVIITAGWLGGMWAGLISGLLIIPLNVFLLSLVGLQAGYQVLGFWLGSGVGALIGTVVGRIRDLAMQLGALARHLDDERESLQKEIVERKRAEEQYRRLFEDSSDGLVIVDRRNGDILDCNKEFVRQTGRDKEQLLTMKIWDIRPPDKRELARKKFLEIRSKGYEGSSETEFQKPSGEIVNVDFLSRATKIGDREVLQSRCRDITEHKKMEEALRKSEERFRSTLDSMMEGCQIISYDWRYLYVNDAVARHGRRSKEELLGKTMMEMYPGIAQTEMFSTLRKCMKERTSAHMENEFTFPDGEKGWFELSIQPVPEGIFILSIEITDRKRAEEALKESEEKYRGLVENSPNLVGIFQEGVLKYVNRAMCERLGWTFEELTSTFNPIEKVVSHRFHALVKENLEKRMRGEHIPPYEITINTRDGSEIPVIVNAQNIHYHGKPAIEFILTDITDRKQLEAERLKVMSRVAQNIAHDLRNPLSAIRTATHLLKSVKGRKRKQEFLELIDRNIVSADKIIRSLVEFTATPQLNLVETDVNLMLKETLNHTVLPKNVRLFTIYRNLPPARLDKDQLMWTFTNLFLNAVEAMLEGGELIISTEQIDDVIEIKIKDTGVGISRENFKKLFTPFFTTKAKGTGLGLINARKTIEAHGGTITVESERGRGTTVTVRLPVAFNPKN